MPTQCTCPIMQVPFAYLNCYNIIYLLSFILLCAYLNTAAWLHSSAYPSTKVLSPLYCSNILLIAILMQSCLTGCSQLVPSYLVYCTNTQSSMYVCMHTYFKPSIPTYTVKLQCSPDTVVPQYGHFCHVKHFQCSVDTSFLHCNLLCLQLPVVMATQLVSQSFTLMYSIFMQFS